MVKKSRYLKSKNKRNSLQHKKGRTPTCFECGKLEHIKLVLPLTKC